ncbi:MAG: TIGR03118 family protein [Actinobacteria bacterium]|nr:TIGR03118 family protein [Actinomycetota bacterium]
MLRSGIVAAVTIASAAALAATMTGAAAASPHTTRFEQVNQVSDQPGVAPLTDPDLVNAWGLASSATSPLWVSDNGSDKATLYTGATSLTKVALVVTVTGAAPTGQVVNSTSGGFVVSNGTASGPARFLFDTENGTIDGWSPATGNSTVVAVNNGGNAVYKGLEMAQASDGNTYLYATNFRSGRVEVYDSTFTPVELPGGPFVDPGMPAGYAPFGIAELGGMLYVTFAQQDADLHDDVAGQGHGFVDVFTNDGAFVRRLVSHGSLNSPWGLALAPAGFGSFAGDLLVGNFGDGHINAYNPTTGAHVGQLRMSDGTPIVIDGLWGLRVGNGTFAGTGEVSFSAGPDGESHGLLGKIVAAQ